MAGMEADGATAPPAKPATAPMPATGRRRVFYRKRNFAVDSLYFWRLAFVGETASWPSDGRWSGRATEIIETALQDVGGGDAVDDFGAALAGHVGGDYLALARGGRQPLVPQRHRQIAERHEIAGELARRLGARAVAAGQGERQADHEPADAVRVDQREEPRHVIAKAPPADGFERARDDEAGVGEGEADRFGADIEPDQ